MKALAIVLLVLVGCGKTEVKVEKTEKKPSIENPELENLEPGTPMSYEMANSSQTGTVPTLAKLNSPYSSNGITINQIITENPCILGFNNYPGHQNQAYDGERILLSVPLQNFTKPIKQGDVYVGSTSYGDVVVVTSQTANEPPLLVGYICPRVLGTSGPGNISNINFGTSNCTPKALVSANIELPGGVKIFARFLDGKSSTGSKFTFCN